MAVYHGRNNALATDVDLIIESVHLSVTPNSHADGPIPYDADVVTSSYLCGALRFPASDPRSLTVNRVRSHLCFVCSPIALYSFSVWDYLS